MICCRGCIVRSESLRNEESSGMTESIRSTWMEASLGREREVSWNESKATEADC